MSPPILMWRAPVVSAASKSSQRIKSDCRRRSPSVNQSVRNSTSKTLNPAVQQDRTIFHHNRSVQPFS